ncbi:FMN-dependent NADH-azoreductase [Opitutus terrae]|uniref:FMN-dependent NADH:quinone oxidoreductase n=1 Tax=Opitutus terrae (strain DSM 11246 / JCM 15787 / PB90-1) TaxID=452637 RepID=AZOR_OPITP|nr:NAD(P)H-dependent oxidoreductase [Opitutus terrae]B1ZNL9.1 RecName: Full=FMN-dependent NADH:quinone oxidoreductase; AltName: Full=Azo-dye reductase; AltName: Full=FMN-dependent NADH-azo compound oxidoreductase; AltName: Full=FMN-dependent NADH-azoreductase [Opitutus terrae PB90-1]ACB74453.1 NAD(P)H dehydrogenase (quinone) [Opitutus terrae PB90-1]
MKTLLVLNSSGRVTRSLTRRLTSRFAEAWSAVHHDAVVVQRDLTLNPPPTINEPWIVAAFAAPDTPATVREAVLRASDELLDELTAADAVVIGAPVYNFGLPAQLKAYVDQIVRVGRSFALTGDAAVPYRALLAPKPVVVMTAASDGVMLPGGALAHLNLVEPHLTAALGFIGLTDVRFVRVADSVADQAAHPHSLAAAERAIEMILPRLAAA